jgi:hypothetical protein
MIGRSEYQQLTAAATAAQRRWPPAPTYRRRSPAGRPGSPPRHLSSKITAGAIVPPVVPRILSAQAPRHPEESWPVTLRRRRIVGGGSRQRPFCSSPSPRRCDHHISRWDVVRRPVAANPTPKSFRTSSCPLECPALRVVAAAGIAAVVREVASHTCVDAAVTANDDSAAAAALLKQGNADVWIPDSRVRAILVGTSLTASAPSVGTSPIVIAANSSLDSSRSARLR